MQVIIGLSLFHVVSKFREYNITTITMMTTIIKKNF